ncbi:MAG: hypothetical protein WAT39_04435 [Planctomycetota bacterium]
MMRTVVPGASTRRRSGSTRELMTDFYRRLLSGETDKLKAFTDAKKALRAKYPDPFH